MKREAAKRFQALAVRYYLILAEDLGCGAGTELLSQREEVSKVLDAYTRPILTPAS